MIAQGHENPSEPALVPQPRGEGLRLVEVIWDLREGACHHQSAKGVEVQINGLFELLPALRDVTEGGQRLLEAHSRLLVGRALCRLLSGLPEVGRRPFPGLAPERVVGQALDMLRQALGIEPLDGLDGPGVEGAPATLEEAAVGHLVSEGVLERVPAASGKRRAS
jgi:hypothetical protein